jgi:hypothetical protein
VSSKCFQLYYTCSDRLLAIALPLALSIFIPSYCFLSSHLFCVCYTRNGCPQATSGPRPLPVRGRFRSEAACNSHAKLFVIFVVVRASSFILFSSEDLKQNRKDRDCYPVCCLCTRAYMLLTLRWYTVKCKFTR